MLSGAMRCHGCGNESLRLDEASGRYVCMSCWQVSDFFEGITEQNNPDGKELCGLRVVESRKRYPESESLTLRHTNIGGPEPFISAMENHFKEEEDDAVGNPTKSRSLKKSKEIRLKRRCLRSWRMSEAFSFLLQHQLNAFIDAYLTPAPSLSPGIVERLKSFANILWTSYLSITGELGGDLWALAFRRVLRAIEVSLESRKAYILCYTPNQLLQWVAKKCGKGSVESKLCSRLYWGGWGSLYCPNETDNANNPFFTFEQNQDYQSPVDYSDADDESSVTLNSSNSDLETDPEKFSARSLRQSNSSPHLHTSQQLSYGELCNLSKDVQNLSKMWKEMLVENLLKKQPKREMFWRGDVGQRKLNWLLEYNLGVIFLSALLASTALNTEKIPTCEHDFFTLHDLSCLCQDREKFPYSLADRWISPHFVAYNPNMQNSFKRPLTPDLPVLAKVTAQLINMLGITERPRLPLCAMIHRFLRQMSLPLEAHQMADSMVAKLAHCVEEKVTVNGVGTHYFLPLQRYFRGEIFAMAIVTVIARLLFKLDGDFERRWSNVARFLIKNPKKGEHLERVLGGRGGRRKRRPTAHFDWSSWACELLNRAPSHNGPNSRPPIGNAPLNTALAYSQIVRTARTTEQFLGSASSFDPQTDEGWGEKHGNARRYASKGTKISLTEPLIQLIHHSNLTCNDSNEAPQLTCTSIPCKSCAHGVTHAIFKRIKSTENYKWTDMNCDALLRVYRFIRRKNMSTSEFLNRMHTFTAEPDEIYMDWVYILENFDSYDPISRIDFFIKSEKIPPSAMFPPAVIDFIESHERQMNDFFSGNPIERSSTADRPNISPESGKNVSSQANASLHWFLETASEMCGAKLKQLLREIECVECLLGYSSDEALCSQEKLRNLALAFHFNYDIPQ